jgi:hypothetical protein
VNNGMGSRIGTKAKIPKLPEAPDEYYEFSDFPKSKIISFEGNFIHSLLPHFRRFVIHLPHLKKLKQFCSSHFALEQFEGNINNI